MSEHIKIEESYVNALIADAAWDTARVPLVERGSKKGDKPSKEDEDDKPDFTTKARKGDKSTTKPGALDFVPDEMKEAVEVHECPLCESVLEEELSDDVIFEHVSQIQTALQALEEASDETEEEVEEDASDAPVSTKREKMLAKIQTMKKGS